MFLKSVFVSLCLLESGSALPTNGTTKEAQVLLTPSAHQPSVHYRQ